jgi:DNA (cytosine-5)-methyltransferase 1
MSEVKSLCPYCGSCPCFLNSNPLPRSVSGSFPDLKHSIEAFGRGVLGSTVLTDTIHARIVKINSFFSLNFLFVAILLRLPFEKLMNAPKLIDLFCGCGGMSLGASRAGFELAVAIDNDSRALASHSLNFPNTKHLSFDLSKTTGQQILTAAAIKRGEIDVVVGGPPCQGFSPIGKRDVNDPRNERLADFFRLVAEIKPKAFIMENVPGILSPRYGDVLKTAMRVAQKDYILLEPHRLQALEAGAPTVRTRIIIVGFHKKGVDAPSEFWKTPGESKDHPPVVRHALEGLPLDVHSDANRSRDGKRVVRISKKGSFFESASGRVPTGVGDSLALESYFEKNVVSGCLGTLHSRKLEKRYASLSYGEMDPKTKSVKLDPNGYCPTLRAGTGPEKGSFQAVRPIHYLRPRVITPREAARLQGFPDWFQFDQTKWHTFRQLGNSVSPLVAEFVMNRIAKVLNCE